MSLAHSGLTSVHVLTIRNQTHYHYDHVIALETVGMVFSKLEELKNSEMIKIIVRCLYN